MLRIIRNAGQINSIKLGDQYIIDGPDDPEEFFEVVNELQPLIDEHIKNLNNPEFILNEYKVKELKNIVDKAGLPTKKLKKQELIKLIISKKLYVQV